MADITPIPSSSQLRQFRVLVNASLQEVEDALNAIDASSFTHTQSSAASVWTVNHNLGRSVSVFVYNSGGEEIVAEVVEISVNQIQITLVSAITGKAICR